jgi:hypothetical protein
MLYMPQYHNGDCWNDMWFKPCDMSTAKNIKRMLIEHDTPHTAIRIIAVVQG